EVTGLEEKERGDRSGAGGRNRSAATVRSAPMALRGQDVRVELVPRGVLALGPGARLLGAVFRVGLGELSGALPEDDDELFHGLVRFVGGSHGGSGLGAKAGSAEGQRGHGEKGGAGGLEAPRPRFIIEGVAHPLPLAPGKPATCNISAFQPAACAKNDPGASPVKRLKSLMKCG